MSQLNSMLIEKERLNDSGIFINLLIRFKYYYFI
jgi:hypothetical protein